MVIGHHASAALVAVAVSALYGRIAWGMFVRFDDFSDHLLIARQLYESGRPTVPHFLFHGVTAALYSLPVVQSLLMAGALAVISAYFLTGGVTYFIYWNAFRESRLARPLPLAILSVVTLVAQPVTLGQTYTLGYLWPEPYHSPTYAMLKPFAVAGFAVTAHFLTRSQVRLRLAVLAAVVTVLGALSKPSFVICVLPAASLLMAHRIWRGQPLATRSLIGGLYVPAVLVLTWQFVVAFWGTDGAAQMYQDSVSWAPLKFMSYWAADLPAKFLASVLFPVTVTALYWPLARRDPLMQFGWLCFGFGALYTYCLVETTYWVAGNFVWSGYITLLTLLISTTTFWLREAITAAGRWPVARAVLCGTVLALHVVSGARLAWLYLTHYGCRVDFRLGQYVC